MEVAIAAMYERLLLIDLPPSVREVFLNLQTAALTHHLPAFEKCWVRSE